MNLLFEIYGVSYPMNRSIPQHCLSGMEPRKYDVGDFGIDDVVHYKHRLLRAIPACPVQGVRSSLD
jgi:hypothetical protein